jgi:hypothetical protein
MKRLQRKGKLGSSIQNPINYREASHPVSLNLHLWIPVKRFQRKNFNYRDYLPESLLLIGGIDGEYRDR